MTPEAIIQVNEWLAGRSPTALSRRWSMLASSWWWYEREKWPEDIYATEAAMCGILLALVKGAWGPTSEVQVTIFGMGVELSHEAVVTVHVDGAFEKEVTRRTQGLALAAILVMAPD